MIKNVLPTKDSFIASLKLVLKQRSKHLLYELSYDPKAGFLWWLKTHSQKEELDKTIERLKQEARKPDFTFDTVTKELSAFKLRDDHLGQLQWYQDAHNQLMNCLQNLENITQLKPKMIKPYATDLRFIGEADEFHQYFQLKPIQRRAQEMYEALTERLDTLLQESKTHSIDHKSELELRNKEAEVKLEEEKSHQKELELKKEEEALRKIEVERDLVDHQRDAEEEAWHREEAQRKLQLEESQQKHQTELQESFENMQLGIEGEPTPTQAGSSPEEIMDELLKQIKNNTIDRENPEVKQRLQALLQAIAGL